MGLFSLVEPKSIRRLGTELLLCWLVSNERTNLVTELGRRQNAVFDASGDTASDVGVRPAYG